MHRTALHHTSRRIAFHRKDHRSIIRRQPLEANVLTVTRDMILPTTVTGSYPRPLWFAGR
jgi:hypothetical protein